MGEVGGVWGRWEVCGRGGRYVGEVGGVWGRWEVCSSGGKGFSAERYMYTVSTCTCVHMFYLPRSMLTLPILESTQNILHPSQHRNEGKPLPSRDTGMKEDERLGSFQKLIMGKAFREEKVGVLIYVHTLRFTIYISYNVNPLTLH